MAAFDFTDPATDAYSYVEAVADELGEERVQPYFQKLTDELFVLVPGLAERITDAVLGDLKEEVVLLEDSRHSRAVVGLIERIEAKWRNDS